MNQRPPGGLRSTAAHSNSAEGHWAAVKRSPPAGTVPGFKARIGFGELSHAAERLHRPARPFKVSGMRRIAPAGRLALLLVCVLPQAFAYHLQEDGYHVFAGENIQEALDAAATNRTLKVVKVHAGQFRPGKAGQALIWFNRAHDDIRLEALGPVTLTAANPEFSNPASPSHPAVVNHVVYFGHGITPRTVLKGFKITGARHFVTTNLAERMEPDTSLERGLFFYADGGGIKIFGASSPTIRELELVDNYASPCGGGISIQQQSQTREPVRIEDCVFRNNRSQVTGAAIDLLPGSSAVISNCLFVANAANTGLNYISTSQTEPEFANSSPLTVFPQSRARVVRCTFVDNRNGVDDLGKESSYRDCIFWRNRMEGGFYKRDRYELQLQERAEVIGCFFSSSEIIDPQHCVSRTNNFYNAPSPELDQRFAPSAAAYQNAGYRPKISH